MSKVKSIKRNVGRPSNASLGIPSRDRHNLNFQRTDQFDLDLAMVCRVGGWNQSDAIREAISKMAKDLAIKNQADGLPTYEICPCCKGIGYTQVRNGDDDTPCPECGQDTNDIPY